MLTVDGDEFLRCLCERLNEYKHLRRYVFRCDDAIHGGTIMITEKRSPTNRYRGIVYMYGTVLTRAIGKFRLSCDLCDPETDPVEFVVSCLEENT